MNASIIALLIILLALVIIVVFIADKTKPRLNKTYFRSHWEAIEVSTDYAQAVLRADSLLDQAMKQAKIRGATMGERLKNAKGLIKDTNPVWSAHKLRNALAHEVNASPSPMQCQKALRQFKKALIDLGAL